MKIVLDNFNAKIGWIHIFRPKTGNYSLHNVGNEKRVRSISFAIYKNLLIKSRMFWHKDIHKNTWTSPDDVCKIRYNTY